MLDVRVLVIHCDLLGEYSEYKVEGFYARVVLVWMVRCYEALAGAGAANDAVIYTTEAAKVQAATCNQVSFPSLDVFSLLFGEKEM